MTNNRQFALHTEQTRSCLRKVSEESTMGLSHGAPQRGSLPF